MRIVNAEALLRSLYYGELYSTASTVFDRWEEQAESKDLVCGCEACYKYVDVKLITCVDIASVDEAGGKGPPTEQAVSPSHSRSHPGPKQGEGHHLEC